MSKLEATKENEVKTILNNQKAVDSPIPAVPLKSSENKVNQKNTVNFNKDTCFTLKRWNLVAMWSWDVECEVCAICRTPIMGKFKTNESIFKFFLFNFLIF